MIFTYFYTGIFPGYLNLYTMLKFLFIFLICFMVPQLAMAQETGTLKINTDFDGNHDLKKVELSLLKNDSVYRHMSLSDLYDEWKLDSVAAGVYQFKVTINDTLLFSFHKIIVRSDKTNTYDFDVDVRHFNLSNTTQTDDSLESNYKEMQAEISLSTLYGNNSFYIKNPSQQNEIYSGEIAINQYYALSKHYALGLKLGGQYSRTIFYNDHTIINNERTLSKYYSYADINLGIVSRFMFYNSKIEGKSGLKLDLGLSYHFPLSFKETLKINYDTKTTTRHIHTYTDFTAMARLVYKHVGVQAEYSITNFLKYYYTEIPQLRFGLVFYIPAAN